MQTEPTGMGTSLINPTDADLIAAQEENLFGLFRAMAALNGGALSENDRLAMHTAFPNSPMFSGVWNAHMPADEVDTEITRALDWMREHNAGTLFWWITNGTQPANLGEELVRRDFIANFVNDTCLAIALDQLTYASAPSLSSAEGESAASQPPPTLVIEEAITTNTLNDWRQVFRGAHEYPDFTVQAYVDAARAFATDAVPWRAFVGYANEEPVSSVMLIPGAGVVSIYALGTLHTARGQGFGAVLARHVMEVARDMGFGHAVTFAAPNSVSFFEHIGFRQLNATISRYLYFFKK